MDAAISTIIVMIVCQDIPLTRFWPGGICCENRRDLTSIISIDPFVVMDSMMEYKLAE